MSLRVNLETSIYKLALQPISSDGRLIDFKNCCCQSIKNKSRDLSEVFQQAYLDLKDALFQCRERIRERKINIILLPLSMIGLVFLQTIGIAMGTAFILMLTTIMIVVGTLLSPLFLAQFLYLKLSAPNNPIVVDNYLKYLTNCTPAYGASVLHLPETSHFINLMEQLVPRLYLNSKYIQRNDRFSSITSKDLKLHILGFLSPKEITITRAVNSEYRNLSLPAIERLIRHTTILKGETTLHYFYILRRCSKIDKGIDLKVHRFINGLNSIQSLSLSGLPIRDDQIEFLAANSDKIYYLDLSYCHLITDRSLEFIKKSFKNLTEMNMVGCTRLTPNALKQFTKERSEIFHGLSGTEESDWTLNYYYKIYNQHSRDVVACETEFDKTPGSDSLSEFTLYYKEFLKNKSAVELKFTKQLNAARIRKNYDVGFKRWREGQISFYEYDLLPTPWSLD